MASHLLEAGATLGERDEDMNQAGTEGVSHWVESDGLGLALVAWRMAKEEKAEKAEKVVKVLMQRLNLKVMRTSPTVEESVTAWNTGREEDTISGISSCVAMLSL